MLTVNFSSFYGREKYISPKVHPSRTGSNSTSFPLCDTHQRMNYHQMNKDSLQAPLPFSHILAAVARKMLEATVTLMPALFTSSSKQIKSNLTTELHGRKTTFNWQWIYTPPTQNILISESWFGETYLLGSFLGMRGRLDRGMLASAAYSASAHRDS